MERAYVHFVHIRLAAPAIGSADTPPQIGYLRKIANTPIFNSVGTLTIITDAWIASQLVIACLDTEFGIGEIGIPTVCRHLTFVNTVVINLIVDFRAFGGNISITIIAGRCAACVIIGKSDCTGGL